MVLAVEDRVKGMSIRGVLNAKRHQHKRILTAAKKEVFQNQKELFSLSGNQTSMGAFYEMLAKGIYGGSREDVREAIGLVNENQIKPDLVTQDLIADQKAVRIDHHALFLDAQIRRYHQLQFMNLDKRVSMQLFRHDFPAIRSFKGSKAELFECLSQQTYYMLEIPLSLITRLWLEPIIKEEGLELGVDPNLVKHALVRRHPADRTKIKLGGGRHQMTRHGYKPRSELVEEDVYISTKGVYPTCSVFKEHSINALYIHTRDCIRQLDMDPYLFNVERIITPKVKVEGFDVDQMPFVRITDKYPDLWLKYMNDAIKPANLFSDANEHATIKSDEINQRYDAFSSKTGRNTHGYNLRKPLEISDVIIDVETVPF